MGAGIYSDEFKREAVKQVVEGGHPVRDVAKRLGVSDKSIYTWLQNVPGRSRAAKQESLEGLHSEVSRLRAELERTKEERDILRKAAAYFAKASE
jgi:transposase